MNVARPESLGFSSTRLERIRPAIQEFVDHHRLPGAITLVARHGKVAHLEAYGMADLEAGVPMLPEGEAFLPDLDRDGLLEQI